MNIKTTDILPKHDLVFLTPVSDPVYGLPIGDGDRGYLLHTENDRLIININKTDLWDDAQGDEFYMWSLEKFEHRTSLKHGARFEIAFDMPVFDFLYQKEYEARLSLADATVYISSVTPFSDIRLKMFSSREHRVAVMEMDYGFSKEQSIYTLLKRWGSRNFFASHLCIARAPEIGLDGTRTEINNRDILVIQKLSKMCFCVCVRIVSDDEGSSEILNSHEVKKSLKSKSGKLTAFISIETGKDEQDAMRAATESIDCAEKTGVHRLYQKHRAEWENFWNKSYIKIKNDFIENLWYLNLYYANSQCRGEYPPHFCNGIWSFNHDFVPWNYYFHYNMQLHTFPLEAANHPELLETYYRFRRNQLPRAEEFAAQIKNANGAMYTDVCDRRGNGDRGVKDNCSCGAQIALGMWQHYEYTGDEKFLNDTLLPVSISVCRFYLDLLKKDENGIYHMHNTQCYEGSPLMDDAVTDIVIIKKLFEVMYKYTGNETYKNVGENIADPSFAKLEADEWDGERFIFGVGKGKRSSGDEVIISGIDSETGKRLRKTYGNRERESYYGFPDVELSPIFPSGVVGLANEGSRLFNAVKNTVMLHPETVPQISFNENGKMNIQKDICMGWCLMPIFMARMGMTSELKRQLMQTVDTWIMYPQGFGQYGPYEQSVQTLNNRWYRNMVWDTNDENEENREKFPFPAWHFRHFNYETLPIISTAVNEMLLQSYDGVIRLFPAESDDSEFCLAASGGFIVEAKKSNNTVSAKIISKQGKRCLLKNVWNREKIRIICGENTFCCNAICREAESIFAFDTYAGGEYIIGEPMQSKAVKFEKNKKAKHLGKAMLGADRMF